MEIEYREREALLEDLDKVFIIDENINLTAVLVTVFVIMAVLFLFIPKIYLSNHIYLTSLNINRLQKSYFALKFENDVLREKIQKIKYRNGVNH